MAYPVSQGKLVNLAAFLADYKREGTSYDGEIIANVDSEDFVNDFDDFEPEVKQLVQVCVPVHVTKL
jgi:salicylate hydroxylase